MWTFFISLLSEKQRETFNLDFIQPMKTYRFFGKTEHGNLYLAFFPNVDPKVKKLPDSPQWQKHEIYSVKYNGEEIKVSEKLQPGDFCHLNFTASFNGDDEIQNKVILEPLNILVPVQ